MAVVTIPTYRQKQIRSFEQNTNHKLSPQSCNPNTLGLTWSIAYHPNRLVNSGTAQRVKKTLQVGNAQQQTLGGYIDGDGGGYRQE